jgi:hypothetical protein
LSEDTQNFVNEHPEFIFEQFDHEFDEDPFQRELGNPRNFFCPDSLHSPSNPTPPPTPPYSASSDEESVRELDSNSSTIPPKKISKAGSKVKSQSSSAIRTKTNSSIRSVSDFILNSEGDPIDFHESRSDETILQKKRDPNIEQNIEPEFDYFEEHLTAMSHSKSHDSGNDSSSSSEGEDHDLRDPESPLKREKRRKSN